MKKFKTAAIALVATTIAVGTGWTALTLLAPSRPPDHRDSAATPTGEGEFSGTVHYGGRQVVGLAPSDSAVVTRPPEAGTVLKEGDVALEVSGRPVRVLAGAVPMYRDLRIGAKGDDVLQLEQALARLGFHPGVADGLFDAATAAGVDAWYTRAGYQSQGPSDDDREKLRNLQMALHEAERGVEEARSQRDGPTDAEIALHEAKRATQEAKSLWNDAKMAESEARAAEEAAAAAGEKTALQEAAEEAEAAAELTESQKELLQAEEVRRVAEARLRQAEDERRKKNKKPQRADRDEEIEQLRADLYEAIGEAGRARAAVEARAQRLEAVRRATAVANREAESTRQAASVTTQRAVTAVGVAERAMRLAEQGLRLAAMKVQRDARASEETVKTAEEGLRLARMQLDAVHQPANTETAEGPMARATRRAQETSRDLAEFSGKAGVFVPANEVIFLASLPVRVDEVLSERAASVDGDVMAVTGTNLTVDGTVDPTLAKRVKLPSGAVFRSAELGIRGTGKTIDVQRVANEAGDEEFRVVVTLDGAPPELLGTEVDVTLNGKA